MYELFVKKKKNHIQDTMSNNSIDTISITVEFNVRSTTISTTKFNNLFIYLLTK